MELIELNVPVERNEDGYWCNPAIPEFEEDVEGYKAWLLAQGIEIAHEMMEDWATTSPAYIEYFEHGARGIPLEWAPAPPAGEGWHTFHIHDTEDGPCWVWGRRVAAPAGSTA